MSKKKLRLSGWGKPYWWHTPTIGFGFLNGAKLGLKLLDVFGQGTQEPFGVLRRQDDP